MIEALNYPFDAAAISTHKRALKRALLERSDSWIDKRIAILGGSTTAEIKDVLELFLLKDGIRPLFYESEYNKFYEDAVFGNPSLTAFRPEIVFIHTSSANLARFPKPGDSAETADALLKAEMERFSAAWTALRERFGGDIIQNNFELPPVRVLGNLDMSHPSGKSHFILRLNLECAKEVSARPNVYINDIHYLSARFGLDKWHDRTFWYAYKYCLSYEAIPLLAHNVASIVKSLCGKRKKALVLDLDNTLWGGVLGDDGIERIEIGRESPVAEAYAGFQEYLKDLKDLGVLLTICSKSSPDNAQKGLEHPDGVLRPEDFASIKANWEPKDQNIRALAGELALGTDAFVFIDDNPAERELVRAQIPEVETPDIGDNVVRFIDYIDKAGYFETTILSADDFKRGQYYQENLKRREIQSRFANYDDYLKSLGMTAEIGPFQPMYFDRIAQLINKTNQFNLTTKRCTIPEVEALAKSAAAVTLYGRLADKFGDNGLVSVIVATLEGPRAHIDLWLMSCRVLQRKLEHAMHQVLLEECRRRGVEELVGTYVPSPKNALVADFYAGLGWRLVSREPSGESRWALDLRSNVPESLPLPLTIVNKMPAKGDQR